ncbi:MAG TPA: hypothetical protein VG347_04405 [Verrucomicrobiae bacterium]|nr:hypothetical protein [Verrucomicrobiae bacterium]
MDYVKKTTSDLVGTIETKDAACVRWRPWPCESCRGRSTPLDFLVRCFSPGPQVPESDRNEEIDWFKKWESAQLLQWIKICPHTQWTELSLPRLAEGSEHLVLFDAKTSEVVKLTHPGIYGDYYEIIDGRITQFDCTPAEYLLRMHLWEQLFSTAPHPVGMTETGQIVSRQQFIKGEANPPQAEVDQFLVEAGMVAVRQPY